MRRAQSIRRDDSAIKHARRMCATFANLIERVLPAKTPLLQWGADLPVPMKTKARPS